MTELDLIFDCAIKLASEAAERIRRAWLGDIEVSYKEDGSSLTEADLSVERLWREQIADAYPSHGILGEEFGTERGSSGFTWVLDPIDGTRQFGAGLLNFASLISVCQDGEPVIGIIDLPLANARYAALRGGGTTLNARPVHSSARNDLSEAVVSLANPDSFKNGCANGYRRLRDQGRTRVFDGGALSYGALARGLIDVCINGSDLDPYDICALCPVVQEAGGRISDWEGKPLSLTSRGAIVASANTELHSKVLEKLWDQAE